MMKDSWRTNNFKEKFLLWIKPTGYRPADVEERFPVYKIDDVYHFEKYETRTSTALNIWSWVQMMMILFFISYLFGNISMINQLNGTYIFWYGGFIFLSVYALTELMDRNPWAVFWEGLRCAVGIAFIVFQDDWFGASAFLLVIKYLVGSYFLLSFLITGWFVLKHRREDQVSPAFELVQDIKRD
jgi:hypothetical protein